MQELLYERRLAARQSAEAKLINVQEMKQVRARMADSIANRINERLDAVKDPEQLQRMLEKLESLSSNEQHQQD